MSSHKVIWTVAEEIPYAKYLFKSMKIYLMLAGVWDDKSLARAMELMYQRLEQIEQHLKRIDSKINIINEKIAILENKVNSNTLIDLNRQAKGYAFDVKLSFEDPKVRASTAYKTGLLADAFINQWTLWIWTDIEYTMGYDNDGNEIVLEAKPLEPDFKTHTTLIVYSDILLIWLSAIEMDTGGSLWHVQRKYKKQILNHITFIKKLSEELRSRISCTTHVFRDYPQSKYCNYSVICKNQMLRTETVVNSYQLLKHDPNSILCPEPIGIEGEQADAEDLNGMILLREIEETLHRVLKEGSLRKMPSPQFAFFPVHNYAFLYTVGTDGELNWWKQPPSQTANAFATWEGPRQIANGFSDYDLFVPAGGNRFYGLRNNGDLDWFQHNGFNDGGSGLNQRNKVGIGWGNFQQIIPGSDGIIYALQENGDLLWYGHDGYKTGGNTSTWRGPIKVNSGWDKFKSIFSVGQGILYAIAEDGKLYWYHHKGYKTGADSWAIRKQVGHGWHNFKHVFGVSDGVVYGIQSDGSALWYKHEKWKVGGNARTWRGPILAGIGVGGYKHLFPLMPAEPDPVH